MANHYVRVQMLQAAVGTFCLLIGTLMLIVPHQFALAAYATFVPHLARWGMLFLVAGAALVAVGFLALPRGVYLLAHGLVGGALLLLAWGFVAAGAVVSGLVYVVMGLGALVAPWAAQRLAVSALHRDLLAIVIGALAASRGLFMLLQPAQASVSSPSDYALAVGFLLSGSALLATQALRAPPRWSVWLAHVAVAVVFWAFLVNVALAPPIWTAIILYGLMGVAIAALPWLGPRLRQLELRSLQVRLALALATAATVPLVLGIAVSTGQGERLVTEEALATQQTMAVAIARGVATFRDLHWAALEGLAAQPGLTAMPAAEQRSFLERFNRAYPHLYAVATFDADGRPLARSDEQPLNDVAVRAFFREAVRTRAPTLEMLVSRTTDRPALAFGAPVLDGEGEVVGLVAAGLDFADFAERIFALERESGMEGYVVDSEGRVLVHSGSDEVAPFADFSHLPPVAELIRGSWAGSLSYPLDGRVRLAGYARIGELGWGVVVEQPRALALGPVRSGREAIFGLLLLGLMAAVTLGLLLARGLAAPLRSLAEAAESLAAQERASPLPTSRVSEIAHLTNVFERMRERLAARTASLEREIAERHKAEEALRRSRDQLEAILQSVADGIAVQDVSGRLIYANDEVARLTGYPSSEALAASTLDEALAGFELFDERGRPLAAAELPAQQAVRDKRSASRTVRYRHKGMGEEHWTVMHAAPLLDERGEVAMVVNAFHVITDLKRAELELQASADREGLRAKQQAAVAELGLRALSVVDTDVLMDVAVNVVAQTLDVEYCKVLELLPDGETLLLKVGVGWREGLVGVATVPGERGSQAGYALHSSAPVVVEDLREETRFRPSPLFEEHGVVSGLSVIIQGEARPYGVFGVHTKRRRTFTHDDVSFVQAVANIIAETLGRQRLLARERQARLEAERATERLDFLAEASYVLAGSLDYDEALKRVAELAVPLLADWCAVDVLAADGALERLAVVHKDPNKVAWAYALQERYPPDPNAPGGVHQVLRSGKSAFYREVTDEMLAASARDDEHLQLLREVGFCSAIVVPLAARDQIFGALTFVSAESGRRYTEADLALAEELARRGGTAVDNARLYQTAQELNATLERRVAERTAELEAMVEQLEAFSYTVSHDLRAPLRGIDGFSQVLLASHASELSEEAQGYLQRIRNSAQRMGTLIEHLLEFSRLSRSALERTCVDLSSLAREIVATLREQEPDREVTVEIAEDLRARGDERLLGVALENLLHNAWKFTRRAREARIEVGRAVTPEGEAFFVRDNGAGFDMRHYAMLFGVFRRLHSVSEFEGTGIGLATVQRIIERHGGRVWAEAAVGEGATFYFTLPEEAPRERHRQAG